MSGTSTGRRPTGKELLAAAWGLLRSDPSLMLLPLLSAVCATLAVLLVLAPGLLAILPRDGGEPGTGAYLAAVVVGWLALFVATAVGVYFQVALLAAVFARLDGRPTSLGRSLRDASQRIGAILAWSAIAASVGTLLRMVAQRGVLGAVASLVASVAWAIAAFFVVPIIAAEGLSPAAAIRRSTRLVRDTWGPSARGTLRFGLVYLLVLLPALAVLALVIVTPSMSGVELALMALASIYLAVASIVLSALGVVVRGVLYRYATGQSVPGVDPAALRHAVR